MASRSHRLRIAVAVGAIVLFVMVLVGVVSGWPPLAAIDARGVAWARAHGELRAWWVPVWSAVSAVFSPTSWRLLALGAVFVALAAVVRAPGDRRHQRRRALDAIFVATTVLVGSLVPLGVKSLVGRPRPAALVEVAQTSFPSAHAFGVTVAVLVSIGLVWPALRAGARVAVAIVGGVLIAVVCIARVALAVHYVSDVVAGMCLAVAWVMLARIVWTAVSASSGGRARSR